MPSLQGRENALFRAALELTPGVPPRAFLDQACAGDPALRARLEAWLAAHEEPGGWKGRALWFNNGLDPLLHSEIQQSYVGKVQLRPDPLAR